MRSQPQTPGQIDALSEMCLRINCAMGNSTKTLFALYALFPPDSLDAQGQDTSPAARTLALSIRDLDRGLYKKCYSAETERETGRLREYIRQDGLSLLHPYMKHYPASLQEIPDRPLVLYARGNIECLQRTQIAIVGSRRATVPALRMARALARQLSEAGIVITSGLARGCDVAAHRGATEIVNGQETIEVRPAHTVAVLGHGIDLTYPVEHRRIAGRIASNGGCLISEFNPGTPPMPHNFPRRNRIIAGLAVATIVVEAGLKSGSLVSARLANEYGRDVFAVPGSPANAMARGCHQLLKSGAHLFEDAGDLAEVLGQRWPVFEQIGKPRLNANGDGRPASGNGNRLSPQLRHYLGQIGPDGIEIDEFAQTCNLNMIQAHTVLMDFEVHGIVRQTLMGKFFKLV